MVELPDQVSVFSAKGGRSYQEDRWFKWNKIFSDREFGWLLAVMDGHGGAEVAEFCANMIETCFDKALKGKKQVDKDTLVKTIELLNESTTRMGAGSTISLVFISEAHSRALVAVLGDSPVIILDRNGKINLSPEHNVRTNLQERQAAVQRGAFYSRGYIWVGDHGLQMARALGDNDLASVLSREPEVYEVELGPESFVVVASDGVFDPGHSETDSQVKRLVGVFRDDPSFDAEKLVEDAVSRDTGDNATAIIWRAKKT